MTNSRSIKICRLKVETTIGQYCRQAMASETIQFQQTDICICHVINWRHVVVLGVRSSKMAAASDDDDAVSATGQRAIFVSTTRTLPVASPSLVATGRSGHRGSFLWSVALDALVLNGREGVLTAIHQDGVLVVESLTFIHDFICNL